MFPVENLRSPALVGSGPGLCQLLRTPSWRTSENSFKANFRECPECELRQNGVLGSSPPGRLIDVTDGRAVSSQVSETDFGIRKVMVMRVFVAGGSGVIGRRLVPQLVARGHQVTATTTGPGKLGLLEQLGADAVVMDGLDAVSVGEAVAKARPDAIVHQMTAIAGKKPDMTISSVINPDKLGHVGPV